MRHILIHKKISTSIMLPLLFILMIIDYPLTYYGMYVLRTIEEANPLMLKFMEMPFYKGFLIRVLYSLFFISLLKYVEQYKYPVVYRKILFVPLSIQIIPYTAHAMWIFNYMVS
ncbi:hypothetical protein IZY60_00780 [Lutibacter sp. B2]|nr:hypothetical protein [Lutibacter sp. B2]